MEVEVSTEPRYGGVLEGAVATPAGQGQPVDVEAAGGHGPAHSPSSPQCHVDEVWKGDTSILSFHDLPHSPELPA